MQKKNSKKTAKKQKLNLNEFDIFRFLVENSSEKNPVSVNFIAAYFSRCIEDAADKNFHDLSKKDFAEIFADVSKQTDAVDINESVRTYVKRTFKKYLNQELLDGFVVKCTTPAKTSADEVYYIDTPLLDNQVILLRDAISVFPYAEKNKTAEIINSLNLLTPVYNRESYHPEIVNADKYKGSYYENLEVIRRAFAGVMGENADGDIKMLQFVYCKYNEKKELVPALRDGKETREVNPVKVLWANGYYYLVALTFENDKARFINFRIDRMKNVKCLDKKAVPIHDYLPRESKNALETKQQLKRLKKQGKEARVSPSLVDASKRMDDRGFSIAKYKSSHPIMYSENQLPVIRIKCKVERMNNVIDTFGFDISVAPTGNPDEVVITLHDTDAQGVKMWAMEYGDTCEILEPASLRDDIRDTLSKMLEIYNK